MPAAASPSDDGPAGVDGPAGPLAGLRVLDLSHMLAGPYAGMLLADLGADVIKVESLEGDFIRTAGPVYGIDGEHFGGYFHSVNRNKRSIAIDLRSDAGRDAFLELVRTADVLLENFRVGVMDRLGLGYERLREENPRLVYGCIRGFGDPRTGRSPYVDWPAYDIVAQAMAGFMSITGNPEQPVKAGPGVGDIFPAVLLTTGLLAAVRHADRTGEGQLVDVGMYDAILSLTERVVYQHAITGTSPTRQGNGHPLFEPFGIFPTSDGWVAVAAPNDRDWRRLTELMGRPELGEDERFRTTADRVRNREATHAAIIGWTSERTAWEVADVVGGSIPVGPVQSMDQIAVDPHVQARQMVVEVEHPGTDRTVKIAGTPIKLEHGQRPHRRAPILGEHSADVLREAGLTDDEIDSLVRRGVVRVDDGGIA